MFAYFASYIMLSGHMKLLNPGKAYNYTLYHLILSDSTFHWELSITVTKIGLCVCKWYLPFK